MKDIQNTLKQTKNKHKKLSIETKISLPQQPALQSVKHSFNPIIENILTHRFAEYKRPNNLRSSAGIRRGTKKVNRSGIKETLKRTSTGTRPGTTKGRQNKKLFKSSLAKGLCMLNSTISMAQPISVNINISNHLVAPDKKRSSSKNKTAVFDKRNGGVVIKKEKTLNLLETTQPIKGISEIAEATSHVPKQITPKAYGKKGFDLKQRQDSKKRIDQKKEIELRKSFEQRRDYDIKKNYEKRASSKKNVDVKKRNDLKVEQELRKSFETVKDPISNLKAINEQYNTFKKIVKENNEKTTKHKATDNELTKKFKFEELADKNLEEDNKQDKEEMNKTVKNVQALFQKPTIEINQNFINPSITFKAQTQQFSLWLSKRPEAKQSLNTTVEHSTKAQKLPSKSFVLSGGNLRTKEKTIKIKKQPPKFPLTPIQTLKYFSSILTNHEKAEILDYDTIYFIGNDHKRFAKDSFDDDNGDYKAYVGNQLGYRYEIIDIFGKGSFGQALKCKDHKTGELVALKVIRSKKKFYQQAMVEVKILKFIKDHDPNDTSNMVHMLDFFVFRKHVCISCEVLGINLYDVIKKNNFRGLPLNLIRRYACQILQSLSILKKHSIIHCDLKPENILIKLKNKSEVKLIDFGSSCFSHERVYTYIQSRFYRAPEVMLALPYTAAIDIWSLGCILAELHTGLPIFPGESEPEQMALIMEINGLPPRSLLARATRKGVFFDDNGFPLSCTRLKERGRTPGTRTLSTSLNYADQEFVDFIAKCLEWNPEKRITPEEALKHPWIVKESSQVESDKKGRIKLKSEIKNPVPNKNLVNTVTTIQSISNITMGSTITPKARNIGLIGTEKHKYLQEKLLQFNNRLKMNNTKKR